MPALNPPCRSRSILRHGAGVLLSFVLGLAAPGLRAGGGGGGGGKKKGPPGAVRVVARVTYVAGRSVYFDRGAADGLLPGDEVWVSARGNGPVRLLVVAVSSHTARAELPAGLQAVDTGDRGVLLVPGSRLQGGVEARRPGPAPEHPPWAAGPAAQGTDRPLLAPAFGRASRARPTRVDGRVFARAFQTHDRGGDRRSRYDFLRAGFDLTVEPGGMPGARFEAAGDLDLRRVALADAPDQRDLKGRVDRLSWTFGDAKFAPYRLQVGRFPLHSVPEFGVLDGLEWSRPTGRGTRIGLQLGALPEPTAAMETGKDFAAGAFVRYDDHEEGRLSAVLAYRRTWHHGDRDRDLFVATLDWRPSDAWFTYANFWVDWYGGADRIKDHGLDLTEAHFGVDWRPHADFGAGATYDHTRWPEMKRFEFPGLDPDRLRDSRVDRLSLRFDRRFSERVSGYARADVWKDQDTSGNGGELAVTLHDLVFEDGQVSLAAFRTAGSFSSGPGLRLSAMKFLSAAVLRASLEWTRHDARGLVGGTVTLDEFAFIFDLDLSLGRRTSLGFQLDQRFGEGQEAVTAAIYVQHGF